MIKRSVLVLALVATFGAVASQAADSGPQVSKSVAKPLKAAQEAVQAKKPDDAIARIKEAQAASGEKTAFDSYAMDVLLFQAYTQKQDTADAVPVLVRLSQSQYATPDQQKAWLRNVALYYYQQKEYAKAQDFADQAVKHGAADADMLGLIAKCNYLQGKYKEAATGMQQVVAKMEKPDEDSLKLLWQFDIKANDKVDAGKTVEKLVTYYPKPEYWANALTSMGDTHDEHLQLNIYRLMLDVGTLKRSDDYTDMAQLAIYQGYPGETQQVLEQGFSKNIFTEQRDKERNQRLLDDAKKRVATDQAQLAQAEKEAAAAAAGDASVNLGADYMTYGMYEKAVAAIQRGISKGNLKNPEEATLLLGQAQYKAKNKEEAQKTFQKLASSSNAGYASLARLWVLRTRSG